MERKIGTGSQIKKFTTITVVMLGGSFFASNAKAVLILPGQNLTPTGTGVSSGVVIYDTTTPFVGTNVLSQISFTGSLTSEVVKESSGLLDFVYQFSDDNLPTNDAIERFTVAGFSGFSTNADYVAGSGAAAPFTVSRQTATTGDDIGFQFAGVNPGTSSDILIINTNATSFDLDSAALQDGGNVSLPAPAPAVPEPASATLLIAVASGMALRRRNAR